MAKFTKKRINVDSTTSRYKGLKGVFERVFRRYYTAVHILIILPLYALAALVAGIALVPGVLLFKFVLFQTNHWHWLLHAMALGSSFVAGYFLYGFSMLVLLPIFNRAFGLRLKAWRGPYYSLPSIPWYIHNGTTYLLRYTFLELVTPTPLNVLFYLGMGMKIGRGTVINTTHISDPSLITLGEKVTIGGSVTIVGHYGQGGFLVLAPVTIGDRSTIGLRASIMGGVKIGREVKILPHSVVMPKTVIPDGETWGGVPARKLSDEEIKNLRKQAA